MRKTKIVATIGPKSRDPETLGRLIDAGADVVRLNFAHGDAETHESAAACARECADKAGKTDDFARTASAGVRRDGGDDYDSDVKRPQSDTQRRRTGDRDRPREEGGSRSVPGGLA